MRMPLLVTIALLGACASSSVPAPQPAPTPSGAAAPATPAPGVAPAPGPATDRATRRALIASDWPLTGRAKPVAVPGSVAGLWEAHRKYGELPWRALVAPAIALARDGHVLDGPRSHQIAREASRLARFPASRAQFLQNGEAPPAGTRFMQVELARTLELIADSGPKGVYRGQTADL